MPRGDGTGPRWGGGPGSGWGGRRGGGRGRRRQQGSPLPPSQPVPGGAPDRARRREVAHVDPDACAGCGACEAVCPAKAISIQEIAVVDQERCTGCGACAAACPNSAISMRRATGAG
ncbi:MAG: 4Fe-4S binding protein [Elusimicrobiota bacterium]